MRWGIIWIKVENDSSSRQQSRAERREQEEQCKSERKALEMRSHHKNKTKREEHREKRDNKLNINRQRSRQIQQGSTANYPAQVRAEDWYILAAEREVAGEGEGTKREVEVESKERLGEEISQAN